MLIGYSVSHINAYSVSGKKLNETFHKVFKKKYSKSEALFCSSIPTDVAKDSFEGDASVNSVKPKPSGKVHYCIDSNPSHNKIKESYISSSPSMVDKTAKGHCTCNRLKEQRSYIPES